MKVTYRKYENEHSNAMNSISEEMFRTCTDNGSWRAGKTNKYVITLLQVSEKGNR